MNNYTLSVSTCDLWLTFTADERVNSKTFGRPNWFDHVKEEHLACRNSVALFDMSTFAKFEVEVSRDMYNRKEVFLGDVCFCFY